MSTATPTRVTPAEYLAFERASELKHELRDGEIVPMVGAKRPHNEIASNANWLMCGAFRGRRCHVYGSDMRVKVVATSLYTYPDLCAFCGAGQFEDEDEDEDTLLNPAALIEILSPSTQSYDRGEKFENYRLIPSLNDFLLIAQDRVHVEHYRRQADGSWNLREYRALEDVVRFESLGCDLPLRDLYDKVWDD